ncbi:MAG TPA: S9 family peptidase [Acidimicrobiia bacterium]|jgi:oligopeptidase B
MIEPADHKPVLPRPERRPHLRTLHGESFTDHYFWMRDRDDPAVLAHMKEEEAYTQTMTSHLEDLRRAIVAETQARFVEDDAVPPAKKGEWWYGWKTVPGLPYSLYVRHRGGPDGPEQVVLDENQLAGEHDFMAVGLVEVDPSHRLVAYSVDYSGDERFALRFREIEAATDLPGEIPDSYYEGAWSADSSTFFYMTVDAAVRPYRLWAHRLGADPAEDRLVFEEPDERFYPEVRTTLDGRFILIDVASETTSETLYLPSDQPDSKPSVLMPRQVGTRYLVEHRRGQWLIVTDEGAPNGRLIQFPVGQDPAGASVLINHDDNAKIRSVLPFDSHLVVYGRRGGLPSVTVLPDGGSPEVLRFDTEVFDVAPVDNLEPGTTSLRLSHESFTCPPTIMEVDLASGERHILKEMPVRGGYDLGDYEEKRVWARAADGTEIPISYVHRVGLALPAPTVLSGYGAYEASYETDFSHTRVSLLDRGVVFAIAHVRGGGEMGRLWHEHGRMASKMNTFTDFITAARHLMDIGVALPGHLGARGVSAGGLLMGAAINLAPDLFNAVVPEVPFMDVINSMLDASLPLTVAEWEEWGNPIDPEQYEWLRAYSPYENLDHCPHPAVLATAGLNDTRVAYWEPLKWVARMREVDQGPGPILLHTNWEAGHGGRTGRYAAWEDEAFMLAFLLDRLL